MPSIEYRGLRADDRRDGFVCGEAEIDKWFRNKALKDHESSKHAVTCANFEGEPDLIGFYALSSVTEQAKKLPGTKFYPFATNQYCPCIQLVYLAVQKPLQNQKHGEAIIGEIIRLFGEIGSIVGMPALILRPVNKDAERLYERMGFDYYDNKTMMVLPLKSALATIAAAEAEIEAEEGAANP